MSKYNGHRNWQYWNVSLWMGNDEGLYREASALLRQYGNRREAARAFVNNRSGHGMDKTPNGARYTIANVYAAMEGMA